MFFFTQSFPMVYALITRMTQSTYESFFRIVQQILPLNYNQLTTTTDYERGLMNAVRIVFPQTKLQGCWFHFCQSVIRYCKRSMNGLFQLFQTSIEAATVLRMVICYYDETFLWLFNLPKISLIFLLTWLNSIWVFFRC